MRWLILIVIVAFVLGQLMHLKPSARDKELQAMRQLASRKGLQVRFWTLAASGYNRPDIPSSGFMYTLPWPRGFSGFGRWAAWQSAGAGMLALAGKPPAAAEEWLAAFRGHFPGAWALLESGEAGLSVLWPERGGNQGIEDLAASLQLLQKTLI